MIKVAELRLGNTVNEYTRGDCEVVSIGKDFVAIKEIGGNGLIYPISIENINPVALTEDRLLRAGFEREKRDRFFSFYLNEADENELSRQRIDYWFGDDDFCAAELCRSGVCFKRVKLKYVHQLQNLIFALIGTELELKQQLKTI